MKKFNGVVWGMPLWSVKELNRGFVSAQPCHLQGIFTNSSCPLPSLSLDSSFNGFQESLNKALGSTDPVTNDSSIKYALGVVRQEQKYKDEDRGGPQATSGMDMGVALDKRAAEEFGFAPRDVYRSIFEPSSVKHEHTIAMAQLSHSKLKKYVIDLYEAAEPDGFSHKVIVTKHTCPKMMNG